jgi:hypothetical protein
MKKYIFALTAIVLAFILESCSAPTYVTSWVDPNFKGKQVKKVMVIALVKDVDYRRAYENNLTYELAKENITAISSLAILNFQKKYSNEEIGEILQNGNYDGLITIKYLETDIKKRIRPAVTFVDYYWGGVSVFSRPGYVEKHKIVKMEVSLFSPKSKTPIWYATTKTRDATDINDLASSIADEITSNLKENGFVK